jgi:hypothetical protein
VPDKNDCKKWSTRDKRRSCRRAQPRHTIEEAAKFLLRSGTVGDVARVAAELKVDYQHGRYSIELFREGGEGAGREMVLAHETRLDVARGLFDAMCAQFPGRLICCATAAGFCGGAIGPRVGRADRS